MFIFICLNMGENKAATKYGYHTIGLGNNFSH